MYDILPSAEEWKQVEGAFREIASFGDELSSDVQDAEALKIASSVFRTVQDRMESIVKAEGRGGLPQMYRDLMDLKHAFRSLSQRHFYGVSDSYQNKLDRYVKDIQSSVY